MGVVYRLGIGSSPYRRDFRLFEIALPNGGYRIASYTFAHAADEPNPRERLNWRIWVDLFGRFRLFETSGAIRWVSFIDTLGDLRIKSPP